MENLENLDREQLVKLAEEQAKEIERLRKLVNQAIDFIEAEEEVIDVLKDFRIKSMDIVREFALAGFVKE